MRVIIGCEFTQEVTVAFRERGHEAFSCDLIPGEKNPARHIQGDVLGILDDDWDLGIFHPPCTYLCSSGLHWNHRVQGRDALTEAALDFVRVLLDAPIPMIALENLVGCIGTRIRKADQIIQPWMFGHDASKSTCLWLKNLPALEYTKIIPPKGYELVKFASDCVECPDCGEPFCEECQEHYAECSCLGPTVDDAYYREYMGFLFGVRPGEPVPKRLLWGNQTPTGQNKLGPSPTRGMDRARTYTGIAKAMGEQWG